MFTVRVRVLVERTGAEIYKRWPCRFITGPSGAMNWSWRWQVVCVCVCDREVVCPQLLLIEKWKRRSISFTASGRPFNRHAFIDACASTAADPACSLNRAFNSQHCNPGDAIYQQLSSLCIVYYKSLVYNALCGLLWDAENSDTFKCHVISEMKHGAQNHQSPVDFSCFVFF